MVTGVLLALAAAACFECSYALQALEVRAVPQMTRASLGALRRLVVRPLWLGSIALGLAGFGLQVLALRHVPLSLVQPLLATGLIGLLVLSRFVLGERVGAPEIGAVLLIIAGVCAIALADPRRGEDGSPGIAFLVVSLALALMALSAFALRRPGARGLLAGAVAADVLATLAAAQAALSLPDALATAAWCALAAAGGIAAVGAESAVLQQRGAARVAPIVLAGQVALPVALAPLVIGERWGSPVLLMGGLLLVVAGSVALASSGGVGLLALGQREDEVGGRGEVRDLRT